MGVRFIALDAETEGFDGELLGVSYYHVSSDGISISGYIDETGDRKNSGLLKPSVPAIEFASQFLGDPECTVIMHNAYYDLYQFIRAGIDIKCKIFDTMIAAHLCEKEKGYGLKKLAERHLPIMDMRSYKDSGVGGLFPEDFAKYARDDAEATYRLFELYRPRIKEMDVVKYFYDLLMPVVQVLVRMRLNGIYININILKDIRVKLINSIMAVQNNIYNMAGRPFDVGSTKQLAGILEDIVDLSGVDRTEKSGAVSTDRKTMELLAKQHELPRLIVEWRKYTKLFNTYAAPLELMAKKSSDGRIRTSYLLHGTATGRLSSRNPNLQNQPRSDDSDLDIRRSFVSEEGKSLIIADYSALEFRLMAHFSEDQKLIRAFEEGLDVHQLTADMLGVDRFTGKTLNFALIYGAGPKRLAEELQCSLRRASQLRRDFYKQYEPLQKFHTSVEGRIRQHGYVRTLLGRYRHFEASDHDEWNHLGKVATNTIIQGSAADLVMVAMRNLDKRVTDENLPMKVCLQVHDEIVLECDDEYIDMCKEIVEGEMENALSLRVPMKVEAKVSKRWEK